MAIETKPHEYNERREQHVMRPTGRMSYEEFLAWADEDTLAEWVDGEVIVLSPASARHQLVKKFLGDVLGIFIQEHKLGLLLDAPFQMRLSNPPRGREPDLLFIAHEHRDRLQPTYLDGPADLTIEIVSAESRLRDRGEKFAEYELGGVPEYWLIDPEQMRADFYRLDEEGRYARVPLDADGVYRSVSLPGCYLRVAWLWQEPLPSTLSVLREWGLVNS